MPLSEQVMELLVKQAIKGFEAMQEIIKQLTEELFGLRTRVEVLEREVTELRKHAH